MRLSKKYTAYPVKHPSRNINQGETATTQAVSQFIHHSLSAKEKGRTLFSRQYGNPQAYLIFTTTIILCLQRFKTQA